MWSYTVHCACARLEDVNNEGRGGFMMESAPLLHYAGSGDFIMCYLHQLYLAFF